MNYEDRNNLMNYSLKSRTNGNDKVPSPLAIVEIGAIDDLFKNPQINEGMIALFQANLVTNPKTFGSRAEYYPGLDKVMDYFNEQKQLFKEKSNNIEDSKTR